MKYVKYGHGKWRPDQNYTKLLKQREINADIRYLNKMQSIYTDAKDSNGRVIPMFIPFAKAVLKLKKRLFNIIENGD